MGGVKFKSVSSLHYIGRNDMATLNASFDNLPAAGYIRQAQLIPHVVPFSSATLWRKCKAGQFPKPVKLSERVTAWRVASAATITPFLAFRRALGL